MKYWEIIANNLSKAGWSWGCVSAVDCSGQTIWIVDAHRDNGTRLVTRSQEKLTAFLELERAIRKIIALHEPRDNSAQSFHDAALKGVLSEKNGT
jgi:hypothetical protein